MAEYTYKCDKCGYEITLEKRIETRFQGEDSYHKDCDGWFFRVWKPTRVIIR